MTKPVPIASGRAVLLDTHVLLWLVSTPDKVSLAAREVLAQRSTTLWVSAASAWEISIKTRTGRLDGEPLLSAWPDIIADTSATELPIDSPDAILACRLPWGHRDLFDCVIVAQATRSNLTIATHDAKILTAALTPTLALRAPLGAGQPAGPPKRSTWFVGPNVVHRGTPNGCGHGGPSADCATPRSPHPSGPRRRGGRAGVMPALHPRRTRPRQAPRIGHGVHPAPAMVWISSARSTCLPPCAGRQRVTSGAI